MQLKAKKSFRYGYEVIGQFLETVVTGEFIQRQIYRAFAPLARVMTHTAAIIDSP